MADEYWTVGGEGRDASLGTTVATTAYTDGSVTASDKFTARAGWGAALDLPIDAGQAEACPGWFGIIDGARAIGAAELAAICRLPRLTRGPLAINADSQMVVDGWRSFNYMVPRGPLARWRARIR